MKKNIFMFIIWKNGMDEYDKILADIKKAFKVRNIFKIIWDDEQWANNLSRFYGTSLPNESDKEVHCGKEYFKLIIVEDMKPKYDFRMTSHGKSYVNINMFDKKTLYREWTGGGHKIHATNDEDETNHDLTLLFGVNTEDFLKKYKKNIKEKLYNKNLVGNDKWNSIEELFYVLNNTTNYVVLRDYDNDFEEAYNIKDYDIDMLCENTQDTNWILNGKEVYLDNHIQYVIKLKDNEPIIDLKSINDGYYDQKLSKDLLKTKILHNGYYIPEREMAYYSCLYHALIHKDNFETEYNDRLNYVFPEYHSIEFDKEHYCDIISKWLKNNKYEVVPQKSNPYKMNIENIKLIDSRLYNENIFEEIELRINNSNLKKTIGSNNEQLLEKEAIIEELKKEISDLNNDIELVSKDYARVINSKGWKMLEKMRKIRNKISQ